MSVTAYDQLCATAREVALLTSTESTLSWDQETNMPAKALAFRASQMSWLSGKAHALATGRMMQKLLDKAMESKLRDPRHKANVQIMHEDFVKAAKIPGKLVIEESETASHAKHAWIQARK
ncbi:MAG: carboxypeptidase M32, partial [Verrucomicrobia bacterium]|nr:carboxypeptidase M32 [Verrucomicrobiota bacterium]